MRVRILQRCFCVHLNRHVQPGEVVECEKVPAKEILNRLVEPLITVPVPENVPDMPGTYD